MSLKHDMNNAYDKVEWNFLEAIMKKLGFRETWVKMVMLCVKSISISLLVIVNQEGLLNSREGLDKVTHSHTISSYCEQIV